MLVAGALGASSASAAERTVTLRPDADRASGWSRSNSAIPRWAHLDDALNYPAPPADANADYLWTYTTADVYAADLQTIQKQAGERVSKVAFNIYAYADSGYKATLYAGAQALATVSVPVGDSNWFRATYTGADLTQTEIDNMHVKLHSVAGTSGAYAQAVYADMTLTKPDPSRTVALRPDSDRISGWWRMSLATPRWAHLDDAVNYPASAADPHLDYISALTTADVYAANLQTVQKQPGERVSKVSFYVYAYAPASSYAPWSSYAPSSYRATLYAGAKSLATVAVLGGDTKWFTSTYTAGDLTHAEIDDMHVKLHSVTGAGARAYAVYADVTLAKTDQSPQSVENGFGTFATGNWPSAGWRPYADGAMFNTPIAARRAVRGNSEAIVDHILTVPPDWDPSGQWRPSGGVNPIVVHATQQAADNDGGYPPTYWPRASDPVVKIHCTQAWGTCEIEGHQIRVPSSARPAGPSDAHMTVVDQASGWEYDMWQVQTKPPYTNGQTIMVSWGGRTQIKGDGLGSNATAAHYGNLAGTVRAEEWTAGSIGHAFTIAVPCTSGQKVNGAGGEGQVCEWWRRPGDAPAMGDLLRLAMSLAEIDAMAVPAWKKTILRALATYGAYVVDTGDYLSIQLEHASTYLSFGYQHPLEQFAQQNGVLRSPSRTYTFDLARDVPWRRMQVLAPAP